MTDTRTPGFRYAQLIADGDEARPSEFDDSPERAALDSFAAVARAFRSVREGEALPAQPALFRWGALEVQSLAGSGGSAQVYRAFDPLLRQPVALKLASSGDGGARLLAEARLMAGLRHPNLRAVFGAAHHDGRTGLWAEWIEGLDLEALVATMGPLSADEALACIRQIGSALAYVHARGIVHGDIKPANVLREAGGRALLTDFGAGGQTGAVAARVLPQGTRAWLAPERRAGAAADAASDQWALAALLAYLLTGKSPEAEAERDDALAARGEEIPRGMREALSRALSAQPVQRYPAVARFVEALSPPPVQRRPDLGRRRWLAVAASVLLVATVGLIWSGQRAVPKPAWQIDAQWLRAGDPDPLTADASLALGDRLSLRLQSDQPLHLYVLNQGGEDVNLLFPLAGLDAINPLASGAHTVPGTRGGVELYWQISVEAEAEHFLVIASHDPLPDFEAALGVLGRPADLPPDQRGAGRLVSAPGSVSLADSALDDLLARARAEAAPGRLRVWTAAFPHQ